MSLLTAQVIQRDIPVFCHLIDKYGMTLRESAASAILTGKPNRIVFFQQGAKSQCFCRCPIDPFTGIDHFLLGFQNPLQGPVDIMILRNSSQFAANIPQCIDFNRRSAAACAFISTLKTLPAPFKPVRFVRFEAIGCFKLFLKIILEISNPAFNLFLSCNALSDKFFGVNLHRCRMLGNCAVHQWLGKGWLIPFIMTVPPVAEHINDHIDLELLAEFSCNLCHMTNRFRIITVHVENRGLYHFTHIRRIRA